MAFRSVANLAAFISLHLCLVSVHAQSTPWDSMDYGPFLSSAVEVEPGNIAYKGIAVPIGRTPEGEATMLFDTDLLRWAGGWRGDGVDLRGIVYDGPHGVHPDIEGVLDWSLDSRPGVSTSGEFVDIRSWKYGPMNPRDGRWNGIRLNGEQVAFSYRAGDTEILETPGLLQLNGLSAYTRTISIDGTDRELMLKILGSHRDSMRSLESYGFDSLSNGKGQRFGVVLQESGDPFLAIGLVQASFDDARIVQIGSEIVLKTMPRARSGAELFMILISPIERTKDLVTFTQLLEQVKLPVDLDHFINPTRSNHNQTGHSINTVVSPYSLERDEAAVQAITRSKEEASLVYPLPAVAGSQFGIHDIAGNPLQSREISADTAYVVAVPPSTQLKDRPFASWSFDKGEGDRVRNQMTGRRDLLLKGATWRRGLKGRCLDFDGTDMATWSSSRPFRLKNSDMTFAAWISTRSDGTIMSIMSQKDLWSPGEIAFFIRDGRLAFDIGWEGVIEGEAVITDGAWHHVAFAWSHADQRVDLYVNGIHDGTGNLSPGTMPDKPVLHLGCGAEDFPASSHFSGFMEGVELFDSVLDASEIRTQAADSGSPLVDAWILEGEIDGARWVKGSSGVVALHLPESDRDQTADLHYWHGPQAALLQTMLDLENSRVIHKAFRIEEMERPVETPTNSWMRFGALDFLPGRDGIVVTTWSGEVWLIEPDGEDRSALQWTRIASGLNQPLGIAVRNDEILVLGRDQVTRLVDLNGDLVTDFYENINNDSMNSEHFHEPATGLQIDQSGRLYYLKAARHAKDACHPHHGTLVRISDDGSESTVLASGFRAPNGLLVDENDVYFCSDQEGHWMPANRINRIEPGGFYGNKWTGHEDRDRTDYDRPLAWIHPSVDRSPSSQLRIDDPSWGMLDGRLLGLSYGTGAVYLILEDEVDGVHQGGVVPLPIKVPTGLMSGRFNQTDGSLYLCGLVGWSSDARQDGGLYRVTPLGGLPPLPLEVQAVSDGLVLSFNEPLDREAEEVGRWNVEAWNYLWSERYGSPDIKLAGDQEGRSIMSVKSVRLSPDRRKAWLNIPDMTTAMQMQIDYVLPFSGREHEGFAHLTVHGLHDVSGRSKLVK